MQNVHIWENLVLVLLLVYFAHWDELLVGNKADANRSLWSSVPSVT